MIKPSFSFDPACPLPQEQKALSSAIPSDPDALLVRKRTAEALTEAGFPTSSATLATKATRGGGPPYRLYGRIPIYRWGDALAWAQSRLSDPVRSTSERDARLPQLEKKTETSDPGRIADRRGNVA
jgi:hypothetical protein